MSVSFIISVYILFHKLLWLVSLMLNYTCIFMITSIINCRCLTLCFNDIKYLNWINEVHIKTEEDMTVINARSNSSILEGWIHVCIKYCFNIRMYVTFVGFLKSVRNMWAIQWLINYRFQIKNIIRKFSEESNVSSVSLLF